MDKIDKQGMLTDKRVIGRRFTSIEHGLQKPR